MLKKIKLALLNNTLLPAAPAVHAGAEPNLRNIFLSRRNLGVNFGSLFYLQKLIFDEFFIEGTDNEFDAIQKHIQKNGVSKTRELLENHWKNYLDDQEWKWLMEVGVTSIRIPIGYWHVNGGKFCHSTPMQSIAGVYENAWKILKENYIKKASDYNISILITISSVPGAGDTDNNLGIISSKSPFWKNTTYQITTLSLLKFIANDIYNYQNIAGLEVLSEIEKDVKFDDLRKFYERSITVIRKKNEFVPIIISDSWNPIQWINWLRNHTAIANGWLSVDIDHHQYFCNSREDKEKRPDKIIQEMDNFVLNGVDTADFDFIIGEYSCYIHENSWKQYFFNDRDSKTCDFGRKQVYIYNMRARSGCYFWTYKLPNSEYSEWSFRSMVNRGAIPHRPMSIIKEATEDDLNYILMRKSEEHNEKCQKLDPSEEWETDRYSDGFLAGWGDAYSFSEFYGSRIGRINAWKAARLNEHIILKGENKFLWEWEDGFLDGVREFERIAFNGIL
ncbi:glycoside hydrolase family 5 protein [Ascoidea rubescens DSM 1968]|uniref:Glycoside hydrolase family 5 protein n=1 Tax=Ascoidea rubescens DSM 1968 TaxID=1344418 RepID=A0A1D2VPA5_9ASCO|nr:glycoside hydrolase family 5 protein [Ascoidea rubescens DSM 1968]ODV63441.1 glycoside hydrolase family 5 protein [Ascoidea rubescens DSM 1968]